VLVRFDHVASAIVNAGSLHQSERFRCFAKPIALLAGLDLSVESRLNSRMIKTNTIGVMPMASSIIDKKSPRRAWREEHRATDLRRRTPRKSPSLSHGRLDLSSWYFLKNSKIEISQKHEISCEMLWRSELAENFSHLLRVFAAIRVDAKPPMAPGAGSGFYRRVAFSRLKKLSGPTDAV